MKVAVSSTGSDLNAAVSPVFGRCPYYVFVDTETMEFEAVANPAQSAPGGAGIQAAQFVAGKGVGAVLTGNVGPNAFNVLQSAGIPIFIATGGTVREAVEAYKAGKLQSIAAPTGRMGRGMGRGMGWGVGPWGAPPAAPTPPAAPAAAPEEELSALKGEIKALTEKLDEVLRRLDRLEKKG